MYDEETEEYVGGIEELSGKIADLTKSAKTPGGLSLFTDASKTEYKSTYQILKEISEIYGDLTDKNQAELLETLAGKRGGQVLAGILDDFSEVEKAMGNMEDSAGSADAEMSIIEESLDYKLNNLKETWTGIIQDLIDRGDLGKIIDFLTQLSEILGNIMTTIGPLPTLLSGLGLGALAGNLDKLSTIKDIFNTLSGSISSKEVAPLADTAKNALGDLAEEVVKEDNITNPIIEAVSKVVEKVPEVIKDSEIVDSAEDIFEELLDYTIDFGDEYEQAWMDAFSGDDDQNPVKSAIEGVTEASESLEEGVSRVTDLLSTEGESLLDLGASSEAATGSVAATDTTMVGLGASSGVATEGLVAADGAMISTAGSANVATGAIGRLVAAFRTLYASNPVGVILAIIAAVGYGAYKAWDYFTISVDEANEALDDFSKKYQDAESNLNEHSETIENLSDSYFNLAKGVDSVTGKNISLSDEDYEEYVETNQRLADMYPELINGVDEYGNYILNLGENADIARQKLANLLEQEKENHNYELYKDLPKVSENSKVLIEDSLNRIESAKDLFETYSKLQAKLKEIASLDSDFSKPFVLLGDYKDEETRRQIEQFIADYNLMVTHLAEENRDAADRLMDSFKDESVGNEIRKVFHFENLTKEDKAILSSFVDEYVTTLSSAYKSGIAEATSDMQNAQTKLNSVWTQIQKNIIGGINFLSEDSKTTEALTKFVKSLPSEITRELSDADLQSLIATWISEFENLDSVEKLKFNDLFDPSMTPEERVKLYNELQANLPSDLRVYVKYVVEEDQNIIDEINASKHRLATKKAYGTEFVSGADVKLLEDFFKQMEIDTKEEYQEWLHITAEIDDATEATEAWIEHLEKAKSVTSSIFDQSIFSEQVNKLDALQSAYNTFAQNVANKEAKINLDISDVESLRETFGEIEGFDFDEFELVVTADTSGADEIQKAFDNALTAYANNKIALEGITEANKDMIRTQIEMEGVTAESAQKYIDEQLAMAKAEQYASANGLELTKVTGSQVTALIRLGEVTPEVGKQLALLALKEQLVNYNSVDASTSIANIISLGRAAGASTKALAALAEVQAAISNAQMILSGQIAGNKVTALKDLKYYSSYGEWLGQTMVNQIEAQASTLNFGPSAKDAAGSAGSDAADAYVEAYEKEKAELENQRDLGLISEKEYLDKLKALIDKFFKDRAEYAEKYMEEMKSYMDGLLSYYNSVISGVTTLLDHRISKIQKNKDETIDALNEEKEAVEERYQAEIDAIQEAIDAKQEEIDKLNEQIEAIDKANEARDRAINLQKAEYNLQRMMNQRTKYVYTGEPGQMRYERDESGLRDAREELRDAQDDEAKAKIQDEIDLIQKEIDALNDQKEALEKQQEEMSKYYEKLIKEQEKYFDEMIEALEDTKSKWEELAEVEEVSKAWGLVSEEMKSLGYSIEDVLNGNDAAFDAFKTKYISVLAEMHSGDENILQGIQEIAGQAPESLGILSDAVAGAQEPVDKLATSAGTASSNVSSLGGTASTAATGVGKLKENSEGISENFEGLNNIKVDGLINGPLTELENKIKEIKDLISLEGGDSLKTALESLGSNLNLQSVIDAFAQFADAVRSVVSAIGGADAESVYGGAGQHGKNGMGSDVPANAVSGGSNLISSIKDIGEAANESIGTNAEDEGENAIGSFVALQKAVQNVIEKVGQGGEDAQGKELAEGTLVASISSLLPVTQAALRGDNEDGVISMFEELKKVLEECAGFASDLLSSIKQISGMNLSSLEGVTVNNYSLIHEATGTAIPHAEGTAKYDGDWGIKRNEKALTGELGPEILLRDGKYHILGKDGPEFVNLKKDDVILNHKQTEQVLSKKNKVGPSHAGGTLPNGFFKLDEDSSISELRNRIKASGLPTLDGIKSALQAQTNAIRSEVRNIVNSNTANTTVNQSNTFNISGVTGEEVAQKINSTLMQTFSGMSLNAYQRSMA